MGNSIEVTGAQSAHRVLELLRLVAMHHSDGVRLTTLLEATGLQRSTVHRLISCLLSEGFVERDNTKAYRLGTEAVLLGLAAAEHSPIVERIRPAMRKLARLTGDTVFLIIPTGDYALCVHREEGPYPVKALTTDVGKRRLLGIGSAGLAILAKFADASVDALYARHASEFNRAGISGDRLRRQIAETRQQDYAQTEDNITPGVAGVGCAFRIGANCYGGISIAAITPRLPLERRQELAAMIGSEVRSLESPSR